MSVGDLKQEACAELFLVYDDVDLYDFFGGNIVLGLGGISI